MPSLQPTKITVSPNDWDELIKQLNYLFKDIYNYIDTIQGVDSKVFSPGRIAAPTVSEAWDFSAVGLRIVPATAPSELTISSGVITVSGYYPIRYHTVDTEADAATDDLLTISGGNPGELLVLQAENDARTVVVKDGANLILQGDFSLNDTDDAILLVCVSAGTWKEVSRIASGATGADGDPVVIPGSTLITILGTVTTGVWQGSVIDRQRGGFEGVPRTSHLTIENGTNPGTLKCTLAPRWNGDAIAATDNISKGATTGDFTLGTGGGQLIIEASGLTGNCQHAIGMIVGNGSGAHLAADIYQSGNDIVMDFQLSPLAGGIDLTALVDNGSIEVEIFYITSQ